MASLKENFVILTFYFHRYEEESCMIKRFLWLTLVTSISFTTQGCTYQAWYEGLREHQRQECLKHISDDVVQRCLDNIENMTYEQYLRSREISSE